MATTTQPTEAEPERVATDVAEKFLKAIFGTGGVGANPSLGQGAQGVAADARLTAVEGRLGTVETKLGAVETRLTAVEGRLGTVETKLNGVDTRLAVVETKLGALGAGQARVETIVTRLQDNARTDFRLVFGALIGTAIGLAGTMAKGFHWF